MIRLHSAFLGLLGITVGVLLFIAKINGLLTPTPSKYGDQFAAVAMMVIGCALIFASFYKGGKLLQKSS